MHRVRLIKGEKDKQGEYKEKCPNPDCKDSTVWVYPEDFMSPCCTACKGRLEGKWLVKLPTDRKTYHFGK